MKRKSCFSFFVVLMILLFAFPASAYPQSAVKAVVSEELQPVRVEIVTANGTGNTLEKAHGWQNAALKVIDETGNVVAEDGAGQVKVRGNSTASGEKKPYNIKFAKKTDLFGFGAAKTYCLLANCFDPTLMRNTLALKLAQELGLPATSGYRVAEVTMDGVYKGCYLLTEKVEAGEARVDIDTDKGEFLIECERDRVEDGVTYVTVGEEFRFSLTDPEEPSPEQLASIQQTLDTAYKVAVSRDWDEICRYFDVDSFTKFYLLNEYFKGIDFAYSSTNFYYKNGKLYAGPVWDFDLSSGNASEQMFVAYYRDGTSYEDIVCAQSWYKYLLECAQFRSSVQSAFMNYRDRLEDIWKDDGGIDKNAEFFRDVYARNYAPASEGGAGWIVSKQYNELQRIPESTFEDNVAAMKEWFRNRIAWLGEAFGSERFPEEIHKRIRIH